MDTMSDLCQVHRRMKIQFICIDKTCSNQNKTACAQCVCRRVDNNNHCGHQLIMVEDLEEGLEVKLPLLDTLPSQSHISNEFQALRNEILQLKSDLVSRLDELLKSIEHKFESYSQNDLKSFKTQFQQNRLAEIKNQPLLCNLACKLYLCQDEKDVQQFMDRYNEPIQSFLKKTKLQILSLQLKLTQHFSTLISTEDQSHSSSENSPIFNIGTFEGKISQVLQKNGHQSGIWRLLKLNDKYIVSSSWDKTIKIWNYESGEAVKTLIGHNEKVCGINKLGSDHIMSTSIDMTLRIWNYKSGVCERVLQGHNSAIYATPIFFPLQNQILTGSGTDLLFWDVNKGYEIKQKLNIPSSIYSLTSLSDDLAVVGDKSGQIHFINLNEYTVHTNQNKHSTSVWTIEKLDSLLMASAGSGDLFSIFLWNWTKQTFYKALQPLHTSHIYDIKSIDSSLFMSISHDQTVIVWTIEGEKIKSINTEDSNYGGLVWDSNTLLCSAYSNIKILK